jgi:hypothetical protein
MTMAPIFGTAVLFINALFRLFTARGSASAPDRPAAA